MPVDGEKIPALAHIPAVALDDKMYFVDTSDTTTAPADADGASTWGTVSQVFTDTIAYRFPNGSDDTAAINEVIANGGKCQLAHAPLDRQPYIVTSDLFPAIDSALYGAQAYSASANDAYSGAGGGASGGTTIFASGFTGTAIINMVNSTGDQYYGVELANFCIEGFSTGGSGAYGLLVQGAWGACHMNGVCIHRPDQHCALFQADPTSGYVPDEWKILGNKFSASRNGGGLIMINLPDSTVAFNVISENATTQLYAGYCTNTKIIGNNIANGAGTTQAGIRLGGLGAGETLELYANSTNLNPADGILLDDSAGGDTTALITIAGFRSSSDGQVTAGSAAIRNDGCKAIVEVDGIKVVPNGAGPDYGAWYGGVAHEMRITGARLAGLIAATLDDGSNDSPLSLLPPSPTTAEVLASGEAIIPRFASGADAGVYVSTQLQLAGWTAATSGTATGISVTVGSTAAAGLTYAAIGIYEIDGSGGGTKLCDTGDLHAAPVLNAAFTAYNLTLSSPFNRVAGKRYAIGALFVGTTPPSFLGASGFFGVASVLPWMCVGVFGPTTLPSSFVVGSTYPLNGIPEVIVAP